MHHGLEDMPERVALAEPPVTVLRERRMIGDTILDAEIAEPPIGQIEPHFLAEPALRANAVGIADDQHRIISSGSIEGRPVWL
jgi:hypothetical protein